MGISKRFGYRMPARPHYEDVNKLLERNHRPLPFLHPKHEGYGGQPNVSEAQGSNTRVPTPSSRLFPVKSLYPLGR